MLHIKNKLFFKHKRMSALKLAAIYAEAMVGDVLPYGVEKAIHQIEVDREMNKILKEFFEKQSMTNEEKAQKAEEEARKAKEEAGERTFGNFDDEGDDDGNVYEPHTLEEIWGDDDECAEERRMIFGDVENKKVVASSKCPTNLKDLYGDESSDDEFF
jgi:hypothetical protein